MSEEENRIGQDIENEVENRKKDFSLVTKALRPPRGGITERLVCQDLFLGTFTTDKSKKISHLCSAAMCCGDLMKNDNGEKAELPFNIEQIKGIYAVNASFDEAQSFILDDKTSELIVIPWAFVENEQNYQKFIVPWEQGLRPVCWTGKYWQGKTKWTVKFTHCRGYLYDACSFVLGHADMNREEQELTKIVERYKENPCPKCGYTVNASTIDTEKMVEPDDSDPAEFFFGACKSLTKMSARQLRGGFYVWAVPILEKAKMQIASFVSPQTYEDVARLLSQGGVGEQNGDNAKPDKLQD